MAVPSKTGSGHAMTSQSRTAAPGTASWLSEPTGFSTPKSISANDNPSRGSHSIKKKENKAKIPFSLNVIYKTFQHLEQGTLVLIISLCYLFNLLYLKLLLFSILSLPHSVLLFHPHISVHLSSTAKEKKPAAGKKKLKYVINVAFFVLWH